MPSLGCKALYIVQSFLMLWSICWSSFLVHFKNDPNRSGINTFGVWWNFFGFQKCSRSTEVLVFIFLSTLLIWWSPLQMFLSTNKISLIQERWYLIWQFSFFFPFFMIIMEHFSMLNSIPISWLLSWLYYYNYYLYFHIFLNVLSTYMLRTYIDKIKENCFKLTKERSRRYPVKTITDANYADDIALLANALAHAETLERASAGFGLHVNAHKTKYMYFNQTGDIFTWNDSSLNLVDKFNYLGSSLFNRDRYRYATSKGMDSYRQTIGHMEVRPDRLNKTQFLPSCSGVDTAI